jgi:hypothetical protein
MKPTHKQTRRRYPLYASAGLLLLVLSEVLIWMGVDFVATWFTPIMWTGYILAADGLVYVLKGNSWLTGRKREFPFLALASIGVWLLFEAYNLRLHNWIYLNVPLHPFVRDFSYFWSFATIIPGVFETAEIVEYALQRSSKAALAKPIPSAPPWLWVILGGAFILIPPLFPPQTAAYLFAPVWIGFIPLLDPINQQLGIDSFASQLQRGEWRRIAALLIGGILCGFLWETWNFQAAWAHGGHWQYTIPQELRIFGWHFGKMPVLGLLGFAPFAIELSVMYSFLRAILRLDRYLPSP